MYGQVVVGPPGSGKTTFCNGMQQYLRLIGRETLVINLDPANEHGSFPNHEENEENDCEESQQQQEQQREESSLPYDTLLDTCTEIINLSTVMEELKLGPNGGLMYCLEYIHHHLESFLSMLDSKINEFIKESANQQPPYVIFDLPGQVELYTHSNTIQSILASIVKKFDLRLVMVQLIDVHYCLDVHKFISAALLSTTTMLRLELPAVNVLSKVDLLSTVYASSGGNNGGNDDDEYAMNGMPFNLDFFMECQELDRLLPYLQQQQQHNLTMEEQEILDADEEYQETKQRISKKNNFEKKFQKLHYQLCDVISDFSLLHYIPCNINDAASVGRVVARIDKCNGYVFLDQAKKNKQSNNAAMNDNKSNEQDLLQSNVQDMFQCAMQTDRDWGYEQVADIQERYMNLYHEDVPELKRR